MYARVHKNKECVLLPSKDCFPVVKVDTRFGMGETLSFVKVVSERTVVDNRT